MDGGFERLARAIERVPEPHRAELLAALDEFSRPLTVREVERALRGRGIPRSRCDYVATALKSFTILAVVAANETQNGKDGQ